MLYFFLGNFMLEYVKKYISLPDLDEWDYYEIVPEVSTSRTAYKNKVAN